jgi:hypothetical protein
VEPVPQPGVWMHPWPPVRAQRAEPTPPLEAFTEAEKTAYAAGWWAATAEIRGGGNLPPPLQAEPVAWLVMDESGYVQHAASWRDAAHEHINDAINEHDLVCARTWRVVPVYTAPPQRKPLTEEEIDAATAQERDALLDHIYEYGTAAEGVLERIRKLCRAVERAHGSKEQGARSNT